MVAPPHPGALWLVRHGQSKGNLARETAESGQDEVIDIGGRDADVPLSDLGERQARAFGRWLKEQPPERRPAAVVCSPFVRTRQTAESAQDEVIDIGGRDADVPLSDLGERQARAFGRWLKEQPPERRPAAVVCSPFLRTRQTAELLLDEAGGALGRVEIDFDERLRDRELGVLDTLTTAGVLARHPEEAERRKLLDKFYHRPPGGESWSDVCLRLRSILVDLHRLHGKERVLLVTHEVPVLLVRYLLEGMSEQEVLALGRATEYANCGLTSYDLGADGELQLSAFNYTVPVEQQGEPVTEESDAPVGPR